MFRCYTCGEPMHGERETIGARCPRCREPLYERPHDPLRELGPRDSSAGACVIHAGNPSVGTCQRCGNFFCRVCRTRWRDRILCTACVDRALEARETPPEEARAHLRQAILAVVFGGAAWAITLLAALLIGLGTAGGDMNQALVGVGVLVVLVSPFAAMLGVGQGAAAVRARGDHMILATIGLILSGLHTGVVVGIFTFTVVFNS